MRPTRGKCCGATVLVGALVVASLAGAAAPASAAVVGSTLAAASFAAPWSLVSGAGKDAAAQTYPVTGTYRSDGKSADSVDLGCYRGTAAAYVDGAATAVTGGAFTLKGDAGLLGRLCDLRAIPAGAAPAPTAVSAYPAVRHGFVQALTAPVGAAGGANAALVATSLSIVPQAGATVTSVAGSGDAREGVYGALVGGDGTPGGLALAGVAALPADTGGTAVTAAPSALVERSGVTVDGLNALTGAQVEAVFAAGTAAQQSAQPAIPAGVTLSASTDGGTGDTAVTTAQPLLFCADASLPATPAKCQTLRSTGVTLARVLTTSEQGRAVQVTDSFTAATAHALSLRYVQGFGDSTALFSGTGAAGSYAPGTDGQALSLGGAPGTLYARTATGDPSLAHPEAAFTYSTRPDSAQVIGTGAAARIATTYAQALPAGGAVTLTQSYATADTDAAVQALATAQRTAPGLLPRLALSPLPAQVVTRSQTLFGTFTAGQNGRPRTASGFGSSVAVNPATGAFALPVVLAPGANTIAVGGIDPGGGTATATVTLTLVDPTSFGGPGGVVLTTVARRHVYRTEHGRRVRYTVSYRRFAGVAVRVPVLCSALAGANGCLVRVAVTSGRSRLADNLQRVPLGLHAVLVRLTPGAARAYLAHHSPPPKRVRRQGRLVLVKVRPTPYVFGVSLSNVDGDGSVLFPVAAASARFS